uniref:Obg-like ATPase 1 n=1 Tax=Fibrocapsa japonica TaxID=94617 RepID=A0A7S2V0U7_9STRA|mmetsp:Transcript_19134/g.27634  ORF Transcript_19134/g.27634 Transcript_19134/m.27634 type:complete len:396 (+) Transcript_19134:72-1259(+)|eukprot:CAMPEP_0113934716 /NCGR_PEP_ID=MMETSP1339-20121228/1998_1 /TAXON_ID=94617 /ORGANISM="Fibrocapsa japonica" /LENGTH=395 /DNA_ID=CAMNT_0000936627 /DNA_START=70 /DNA_END=1257 /DNA_ORIENTATION=- /assembly_acc=CAM_ASM_000762
MAPKKAGAKGEEAPRKLTLGRPGNNVKIGIVGMPNVGKSSFFNLLAKLNVPAENFPFCTIDPNVAMVPVPDRRFNWLVEHFHPASVVPPVVTITDIAGLVRGAAEGAGLGNAFLSHISATDAIYMMLRAFEGDDVTHVEGDVNPVRDMEIIFDELLLKDIDRIKGAVEGMAKNVSRGVGGREKKQEFDSLEKILKFMEEERKWVRFGEWTAQDIEVLNQHQLLTAKEIVYLVNLSKRDYLRKANKWLPRINEAVQGAGGGQIIPFSVAFEQELYDLELSGKEQLEEYLKANPTHKSALPRILRMGYHALQLIHFFTCGSDEVKGWTIRDGKLAPEAAGVIHSDFERGFICAEVQAFEDLKELGSEEAVKKSGKLRQQGKKYVVQDGDIIFFKFNV